jgi:hypothetical protein
MTDFFRTCRADVYNRAYSPASSSNAGTGENQGETVHQFGEAPHMGAAPQFLQGQSSNPGDFAEYQTHVPAPLHNGDSASRFYSDFASDQHGEGLQSFRQQQQQQQQQSDSYQSQYSTSMPLHGMPAFNSQYFGVAPAMPGPFLSGVDPLRASLPPVPLPATGLQRKGRGRPSLRHEQSYHPEHLNVAETPRHIQTHVPAATNATLDFHLQVLGMSNSAEAVPQQAEPRGLEQKVQRVQPARPLTDRQLQVQGMVRESVDELGLVMLNFSPRRRRGRPLGSEKRKPAKLKTEVKSKKLGKGKANLEAAGVGVTETASVKALAESLLEESAEATSSSATLQLDNKKLAPSPEMYLHTGTRRGRVAVSPDEKVRTSSESPDVQEFSSLVLDHKEYQRSGLSYMQRQGSVDYLDTTRSQSEDYLLRPHGHDSSRRGSRALMLCRSDASCSEAAEDAKLVLLHEASQAASTIGKRHRRRKVLLGVNDAGYHHSLQRADVSGVDTANETTLSLWKVGDKELKAVARKLQVEPELMIDFHKHLQDNGNASSIDQSIYGIIMYNTKLHACARAAAVGKASYQDAEGIWDRMQEAGVTPSLFSFNKLLVRQTLFS